MKTNFPSGTINHESKSEETKMLNCLAMGKKSIANKKKQTLHIRTNFGVITVQVCVCFFVVCGCEHVSQNTLTTCN